MTTNNAEMADADRANAALAGLVMFELGESYDKAAAAGEYQRLGWLNGAREAQRVIVQYAPALRNINAVKQALTDAGIVIRDLRPVKIRFDQRRKQDDALSSIGTALAFLAPAVAVAPTHSDND